MKSAPKEDSEDRSDSNELKNRPKWGQGTAKVSKAVKNSDKDPSYQRNKRQKEKRRRERQKQLLAEADKYAKYVPGDPAATGRGRSRSPPRSRATTTSRTDATSRSNTTSRSPPQGRGGQTADSRATQRSRSVRGVALSPPIPALRKAHDPAPEMESELPVDLNGSANQGHVSQNRSRSPPVPAMKHRLNVDDDYDVDTYNYEQLNGQEASDASAVVSRDGAPGVVPFVRSMNVLDPAHAESPVPISRENTAVRSAIRVSRTREWMLFRIRLFKRD